MDEYKNGLALTILSVAIAIAAMFLLRWLHVEKLYSQAEWFPIYKWGVLPAFAICSFVFGFVEPIAPWRWPLLMIFTNYFSGFWIMQYWGQFPPYEIILMGVLAIPMIMLGYLGLYIKKKFMLGGNVVIPPLIMVPISRDHAA